MELRLHTDVSSPFIVAIVLLTVGIPQIQATVADRNSSSLWLEIFTTFPQWNGTYLHNYSMFPCFINVNSVHTTGINATFSDDDSEFDMSGYYFGGDHARMRVVFTMTKLLKSSPRFNPNDDFQIAGYISRKPGYTGWLYIGNATKPDHNLFQGFHFSADNGKIAPADKYTPGDESLRIGLTIGISLTCAFLGVAAMVAITVWAIRKGYLRHVPSSYESFKNPSTTFSAKDNSLHI